MDVCLPADFQIVDDYREPMRFVDEGPASYEDGYWLGGEALVAPLPAVADASQPAPRARRTPAAYDPTWCVV